MPQPFPAAGRLFGVAFLLSGLKLLWDLIQAVIEIQRAAAWRVSDVFSLTIWLAFTMVFLLPGWIITTLRRTVAIDPGHGVARQVNDFLVYRWSSSRPLHEFDAVRLFLPKRSSSSSTRARANHHVTLSGPTQKELLVCMDESEDGARAVAQEIALFTSLTLRDEIQERSSSDDDSTDA